MVKTSKIPFYVIKKILGEIGYTNVEQIAECEYKAINPLDKDIRVFNQILCENMRDIELKSIYNQDYLFKAIGDYHSYKIEAYMVNLGINFYVSDYNIHGDIKDIAKDLQCIEVDKLKNDLNSNKDDIVKLMLKKFMNDMKNKITKRVIAEMRETLKDFNSSYGEEVDKQLKKEITIALDDLEKELNN